MFAFLLAKSLFDISFCTTACDTKIAITLSFGGKPWAIDPRDMNLGPESPGSSTCVGAIFDLNGGWGIQEGGSTPSWIVGDTFLKNVYSIFSAQPPTTMTGLAARDVPMIGMATLSSSGSAT